MKSGATLERMMKAARARIARTANVTAMILKVFQNRELREGSLAFSSIALLLSSITRISDRNSWLTGPLS